MNKKSFFSLMGGVATLSLGISAMAAAPGSFEFYLNNNTGNTLKLQVSKNLNPIYGTEGTFKPAQSTLDVAPMQTAVSLGTGAPGGDAASGFIGSGSVVIGQGETSCEVAYTIQYTQENGQYVVVQNASYYKIVGGVTQCDCVEKPGAEECPVSSDGNFYVKWVG